MPRGVRLDRAQHVPAQPRHVAEEPLVGRLAQGHVEPHLVLGDLQALAVRGDVGRDERGGAGRAERQADVAGGEHLGGERAERLAELAAEDGAADRGQHRRHRAELGAHLLGHQVAHRADHPGGDRVAQLAPHVEGVGRSTRRGARPRPSGCPRAATDVGSSHRSARRSASSTAACCGRRDGRVVARAGLGDLAGQIPVDRAAARVGEHLLQLGQERCICARVVRVGSPGPPGSAKPNGELVMASTVPAERTPPTVDVRLRRRANGRRHRRPATLAAHESVAGVTVHRVGAADRRRCWPSALIGQAPVPYVRSWSPAPRSTRWQGRRRTDVIEITGADDQSTSAGQLRFVTVGVQPELTLLEALIGLVARRRRGRAAGADLPAGPDRGAGRGAQRRGLRRSQSAAETAALTELGYPVQVASTRSPPDAPADGKLQAGDVITSVDGTADRPRPSKLIELIRAKPAGTALTIGYHPRRRTGDRDVTTRRPTDGDRRGSASSSRAAAAPVRAEHRRSRIGGPRPA